MIELDTVNYIIESSKRFYDEMKQDPNARYRSWEHCYSSFYHARGKKDVDIDYLSLQLAFYLASWGMYRGSSFLLQKDYKIHIPVIKELLKEKYDSLMGIECSEYRKLSNQHLLEELNEFVSEYYETVRDSVKTQEIKNDVSNTLITKILMGTLGCVPAYDRYFISGIKRQKVAIGNYNIKSVLQLVDFYEKNADKLNQVQKSMKVYELPYPQMKIIDMGFWQIGYDLDTQK
jgi:hypothetical protein